MADKLPVAKVPLHVPLLENVAAVLEKGLGRTFADVSVSVTDCPDLMQEPFKLACQGLCGSPRLADTGGPPYLLPLVQRDKIYNMEDIVRLCELPAACVIGAGSGPSHVIGVNSEFMANASLAPGGVNRSSICRYNPQDGGYILEKTQVKECSLLLNAFLSEGHPGKVLKVQARGRTGSKNFMTALNSTLKEEYGEKPVAVGGVFVIERGKAKIHVMPDFSTVPLNSDEEVDNWLRFYEMSAPLVAIGYVVSHDPGFDFRMEHFHCYSDHGDGGHYHYDTTPADVSYLAYLNVAEYLFRIDRPPESHDIGRDKD